MTRGSAAWTVLALVRHGQSEGNLADRVSGHTATPLTDVGHDQARATARALADDFEPTAVVASDLVRARQTALPIARECAVELTLDERLRERSLGELDGLTFDEAAARAPAAWARIRANDPTSCPPGAERVEDVYARVSRAIDDIVSTHSGGRVVVVSHGIALFHALCHIFGLGSPGQRLQIFTLVANCSISRVTHRGSYWYVTSLNERQHLRALDSSTNS